MEHERFNSELDDLLQDIHRLIDENNLPAEVLPEDEFDIDDLLDGAPLPEISPDTPLDLSALFEEDEIPDEEPQPIEEPAPEPEPVIEPEPQPEPEIHRQADTQAPAKQAEPPQKDQDQAYADWLYEQEHPPKAEPAAAPVQTIDPIQQTRWTERQKVPRHVAKLQQNQEKAYADWLYEQDQRGPQPPPVFEEESDQPKKKRKKKKAQEVPVFDPENPAPPKPKRHGFRNFLIFLLVLALAMAAAVVFLLPRQPISAHNAEARKDGVSNVLLIGTDAGGARTDVLMLLSMNQSSGEMALISIPRDTLVNGSYAVPKINTVYGANNGGAEGIEMLMTRVDQCVGFRPDGYILFRLDTFTKFVDALGGVEFDVPVDMFYNDESQNLHIALEAGKQLLSGEEAMGLVRFRSGYADADLGRVQVQRDFLSALVKQAISPEGALRSPLLLNILQTGTETDLTAGNFLWLAKSVLLVDRSHIGTATLPGSARNFESGSYYVLDPASVAQTVNTYCNPYVQEIAPEDLQIRTN